MNESTPIVAAIPAHKPIGLIWKVPLAVILSPLCVLIGFIGEVVGGVAGFSAVAVCFLVLQYLLSKGLTLRQSWPILLGTGFLPLCLGIMVIFVEQKSGAWRQGVLIIILSLTCSLAGAALASRCRRTNP